MLDPLQYYFWVLHNGIKMRFRMVMIAHPGPGLDSTNDSCGGLLSHLHCTFLMHLQCISKALPRTLTHCILDSACYATPHHPLHPRLCMCHLHLFVCLFTFVTGTCVACFVCLFPLPDWFH